MIDLFAADLCRIMWRSMTRVVAVVAVVIIVAIGVVDFQHTAKHPFDMRTGFPNAFATFSGPLVLAAFLFGASLLGADYTSRSLTTLLTWEPRRARLLFSRAATSAAVAFCASLAAMALLVLALLPAALSHGTGHSTAYASVTALAMRSALLAAAACAIGVSCAAIGRSTAAAVIGALVYLVVIERAVVAVAPDVGRWLLLNDSLSWVAPSANASNGPGGVGPGHTIATSGLLLLIGVIAIHALATLVLRRRDIV
jgi:ABC-type transport system involved in multi-copper enzyme maturation permease subunit